MAYNRRILFKQIEVLLTTDPSLTLSKLADLLNIDRHTVERFFRIYTGITFREYKQTKVMDKLKELTSEDLTLKQVALKLGYHSEAALARFVKSKTGKTPAQIREMTAIY